MQDILQDHLTGILYFAPGETSKSIRIVIKGDKQKEQGELFYVNLSGAIGGTLSDSRGIRCGDRGVDVHQPQEATGLIRLSDLVWNGGLAPAQWGQSDAIRILSDIWAAAHDQPSRLMVKLRRFGEARRRAKFGRGDRCAQESGVDLMGKPLGS